MNNQSLSGSATAGRIRSTKNPLYFARLMRPEEVAYSTKNHPGHVQEAVSGHWMLCGDVSSEMFQLLSVAPKENFPTRLTAFRSPSGVGYGVLSHQVAGHQSRFLFNLSDPPVRELLVSTASDRLGFMLGNDDSMNALVLESPLKPVEFLPVLSMSHEMSKEEQMQAVWELPFVVEAMSNPLQVPSLFEGQSVRHVSVSLLLPSVLDQLARAPLRNGCRK